MARSGKDKGVVQVLGKWYARWTVNGKEYREVCNNKTAAKIVYGKKKADIREEKNFPEKAKKTDFKTIAESHLRYAKANHSRKDDDKTRMDRWIKAFGTVQASTITPGMVENVLYEMKEEKKKPATIARYLVVLKAAFNRAVKIDKFLLINPVALVAPPQFDNEIQRSLSQTEEENLFKALPPRLHSIVIVALHTGARQGELLKLTWAAVDFSTGTFLLKNTKAGDSRRVIMNSLVLGVLSNMTGKDIPGNRVFRDTNGGPMDASNLRRDFREAVKTSGIASFRFHDLRHTFASRLWRRLARMTEP